MNIRNEEAVASLRNGFNVPRIVGVVPEGASQLSNCDPQAAVEIDKGIFLPDAAPNCRPSDHLASVFQQDYQESKRLLLQTYPLTLFQEFACSGIYFKGAKSIDNPGRRLHISLRGVDPRSLYHSTVQFTATAVCLSFQRVKG